MENMVKKGKNTEEKSAKEKSTGMAKAQSHEVEYSDPPNEDRDSAILLELRGLRKEHAEAVSDNKRALARLETSIGELMVRTTSLEQKVIDMEERLGNNEDKTTRMERVATFLLRETTKLSEKCNDLESRMRRNNIRIHGIPEGAEKNDTVSFITQFIKSQIQIAAGRDLCIERAHRSLVNKPKDSTAPPRAIIVRFLDYKIKEQVIKQAWSQKICYEGRIIYFNQDYTTEVQKKRKQAREVIKQLKERDVKAQSPYPAQLKVFLDTGTKIFSTVEEAYLFIYFFVKEVSGTVQLQIWL
uniref:L1 transposable element RRM domain-containing protein n=1 Tax=Poecilia mexicana TaxID=48701 RepID=A0A3B3YAM2_9TELE